MTWEQRMAARAAERAKEAARAAWEASAAEREQHQKLERARMSAEVAYRADRMSEPRARWILDPARERVSCACIGGALCCRWEIEAALHRLGREHECLLAQA